MSRTTRLSLCIAAMLLTGCAAQRTLVLRDSTKGIDYTIDVDRGYFADGENGATEIVLLDRPGGDESLRNLIHLRLFWNQRKPAIGGADASNATLVWSVSGDDRSPALLYDGVGPAFFERDGNVATLRLQGIALRVRADNPATGGIDRGQLRGVITLRRDTRRVSSLLESFSVPATAPAASDNGPPARQSAP